jgi:hypothetical protein
MHAQLQYSVSNLYVYQFFPRLGLKRLIATLKSPALDA